MLRSFIPTGLRWSITPAMLLVVMHAHADPWTLTPSLTLSETFTDNVRLAPSGSENSDLITTVTPGISIVRESRRLELDVNYRLQGIAYKNNSSENKFVNLLDAKGTGELLEDRFFLDASASSSEQNIANSGSIALDNTSLTDDRANVVTYSISPYWQERIGNLMDAELRYERNAVESSRTFDSVDDIVSFNLSSGTEFNRLLWDLHFENEKIDNEGAGTTRFRNVTAEAMYLITEKLAFKAVGGYDDNEFSSTVGDTGGLLWRVGGVWRPSRRTSFEATFGERFFGTDIFIDASHHTRKTKWLFTFYRRPDTTRSFLFEQQVFPLTDNFGDPVVNPVSGDLATVNVNVPVQTAEVLIRERFNGVFEYTHRKNTLNLTAFFENREFQLSGRDEDAKGVELSWIWAINRNMDSRLRLAFSSNDSASGITQNVSDRTQDFSVLEYRLTKKINPGLDANIGYRYVGVDSNIANESYTENRIFASVNKRF